MENIRCSCQVSKDNVKREIDMIEKQKRYRGEGVGAPERGRRKDSRIEGQIRAKYVGKCHIETPYFVC